MVDCGGTVAPLHRGWQIGWAVGAEDRWHVAAEEAAVRSRLVEDMPVTETAMRVPGGDIVQRAAAVRDAAGRAVVLEFVNQTPAPVSLALAVCGPIEHAGVRGSRLLADGRVALELARTPGGATAVADGGVWGAVRAEPPATDCEARSRQGRAAAAAVVPLASKAALRAMIPVEGGVVEARAPEQASAGWRAVVAKAAAVDLPDDSASRAWRRGVAASVLAAGAADVAAAARAAVVLDRVGLAEEADRGRDAALAAAERARTAALEAVAVLRALASRRLRTARESGLAEVAGPLVAAAGDLLDAFTVEQVAAALEAEAPAAARDARRLLAEIRGRGCRDEVSDDDGRAGLSSCVAFGGDGLWGIEYLLDRLVAEAADHLVVAPDLPQEWIGSPIDVRSVATRHGPLSFSLRWHGSRPAVLWELAPPPGGSGASDELDGVALRCGLDSSWSAVGSAGEALLGL